MKTKKEAIERIKQIQNGLAPHSEMPETMKGSIAKRYWHDEKFSLGAEYGQIEALMWAFEISEDEITVR